MVLIDKRKFHMPKCKLCLINLLSIAFILLLFTACSSKYTKINPSTINTAQLEFAEQMALKIMNKCDAYDYTPLTLAKATPEAVKGFSATVMQQSCDLLRNKYGTFRGIEFAEAYKPIDDNSHIIYRFKGNFKQATKFPEIRITIDQSGKFAGFFTTKWMDEFD